MDRAKIHPFLCLLPCLVCSLQLPLDGRTGYLRLGATWVAQALQPGPCSYTLRSAFRITSPPNSVDRFRRTVVYALLYLPESFYSVCNTRQSGSGRQLRSCCTAWIRSRSVILRSIMLLLQLSSGIATVMLSRRWERQQLKWLTRGTLLAVTPFTLLNVIPYLSDWSVPASLTKLAGLSLVILPLTFSWAIVRYRLMDVDLIFKRGVTYTPGYGFAGRALLGVIALMAELIHTRLPEPGHLGPDGSGHCCRYRLRSV